MSEKFFEAILEYQSKGFAARIGFGERPSLLVIDLITGFTDPSSPLGADLTNQIQATNEMVQVAHRKKIPVVFTTITYEGDGADAGHWIKKIPSLRILRAGSRFVELDPRLVRSGEDLILVKKYASAFCGTPLASLLASWSIDTVLIAGCTTSGCVRASAVDALQFGFRPIVVREAVGDRLQVAHEANLFDIDAKYGDVVSLEEALRYLSSLPEKT